MKNPNLTHQSQAALSAKVVSKILSLSDKQRKIVFLRELRLRGLTEEDLRNLGIGLTSADLNKAELIRLATQGNQRPSQGSKNTHEKKLALRLGAYTGGSQDDFDPEFTKRLKGLAPSWFTSSADYNKVELLQMAQSGESRPSAGANDKRQKHLGIKLNAYISKANPCFDIVFFKKIKSLRPDWLDDKTTSNKKRLLALATIESERPSQVSKDVKERRLYACFLKYTAPKNKLFDPKLTNQLKALAPHWFVDTASVKKDKILQLAKKGKGRPSCSSSDEDEKSMGEALVRYTNRSRGSFDPLFTRRLRAMRPDWFKR
jgi:hypothetical protein